MIRGILRGILLAIVLVVLIGGASIGGYGISRILFPPVVFSPKDTPTDWTKSFSVFWEAWNYVHLDFYKPAINDDNLVNGAVSGMVDALGDSHTIFIAAKEAVIDQATMQGSFEGIGATVEMREGRLTVVSPIKDSPAARAGIKPDDIILKVNGTVIQNMTVTDAVSLIRGPKGTTVTLDIQRAKQAAFSVSIVRDTIRTFSVDSRMIPDTTIGYISLAQFTATSPQEIDDALRALMQQKPTGLILDLRGDPGGLLNATLPIASEFLPADKIVVIVKDKNGAPLNACADNRGRPGECKTVGGGVANNIPLILLVNNGSASASEIISAAMKDYKRATIVGIKTYGKGSVQTVHTLSDKSELNVTTAHFFSPLGNEIDQVGVTPDIEIKITDDDIANKRDPQLDKAIELLKAR